MTTGATGGYQPPGGERPLGTDPLSTSGTYEGSSSTSSGGSTTDAAKEHAAQVGSTAKQAGTQVAGTAKDQAAQVATETKTQARNLMNETKTQVQQQAGQQKEKAAGGLRSLSDELRSLASGDAQPGQSGMVTDYAHQAADKMQELASLIENKEPGELIEDLRSFARRKPGMFLIGAATAGILAGRLTRGAVDAKRSESDSATSYDNGSFGQSGAAFASTGGQMSGGTHAGDTLAGSSLDRDDDIVLVEETVVVESDPFGPRTTVGGDRL